MLQALLALFPPYWAVQAVVWLWRVGQFTLNHYELGANALFDHWRWRHIIWTPRIASFWRTVQRVLRSQRDTVLAVYYQLWVVWRKRTYLPSTDLNIFIHRLLSRQPVLISYINPLFRFYTHVLRVRDQNLSVRDVRAALRLSQIVFIWVLGLLEPFREVLDVLYWGVWCQLLDPCLFDFVIIIVVAHHKHHLVVDVLIGHAVNHRDWCLLLDFKLVHWLPCTKLLNRCWNIDGLNDLLADSLRLSWRVLDGVCVLADVSPRIFEFLVLSLWTRNESVFNIYRVWLGQDLGLDVRLVGGRVNCPLSDSFFLLSVRLHPDFPVVLTMLAHLGCSSNHWTLRCSSSTLYVNVSRRNRGYLCFFFLSHIALLVLLLSRSVLLHHLSRLCLC